MFSLPDSFFLENTGIYICFGTVSSSLITGFLLMRSNSINNSKNNEFQLKREREQRIWQAESDRQKWYREKLYESYRTSIQILTNITHTKYETFTHKSSDNANQQESKKFKLYFEFTSELDIITAGHPDKNIEEFKDKITKIKNDIMEPNSLNALGILLEIMEKDPRIKDLVK